MKIYSTHQKTIDFVKSTTAFKKLAAEELTDYISDGGKSDVTINQFKALIRMLNNAAELIKVMDAELSELNDEIAELKSKR